MRTGALVALSLSLGALLLGAPACSSNDRSAEEAACQASIQQFRELMIVDEAVVTDARAKNANDGPWSFRYLVENMAPPGVDASKFVYGWLEHWVNERTFNGFQLDRPTEERVETMRARILCPWQRATAENACDETCSNGCGTKLDLAKAPFRLMGIVNRIDLRDEVIGLENGEGRIAFALTEGAGDDPSSRAAPMTVIFEYVLGESKSLRDWATTWHELSTFNDYGEAYLTKLEAVTNAFTRRGARPGAVNGSSINQVRTNESALNWIWQQREFGLMPDGNLRLRPVRNTPGEALNGSTILRDWLNANREAVLANRYEIPAFMLGGSADQLIYTWNIPGVDTPTHRAFAAGTCNGCHSTEAPNVDTAFHMSPFRKGIDKISHFIHDPSGRGGDDLERRQKSIARALCTNQ